MYFQCVKLEDKTVFKFSNDFTLETHTYHDLQSLPFNVYKFKLRFISFTLSVLQKQDKMIILVLLFIFFLLVLYRRLVS